MDGSGHIDMAVLRDADDPELFASAADGGLESREDYLQNGLADVAALIDPRRGPLVYTNDALNRLKKADEGHKSGGTIASSKHTRNEEWTLSQTGNWSNQLLDLNGDGDSSDTDEKTWDSSFNKANEYYTPSTTPSWGPYKPVYDDAGNMTDDGRDYKYIYDGFGRLAEVQKHGSSTIVAQYRYNGLGYRTGWHYDIWSVHVSVTSINYEKHNCTMQCENLLCVFGSNNIVAL